MEFPPPWKKMARVDVQFYLLKKTKNFSNLFFSFSLDLCIEIIQKVTGLH